MGIREKFEHIWNKEQSPTDRGMEDYLHDLHLRKENLEGKKILDVGAGLRVFAKEAREEGVGADIVSVDPFYMLSKQERVKVFDNDVGQDLIPAAEDETVDDATVAGVAEELPFKDESFDLVVSDFAQPFYAEKPDEIKDFFEEALRILKPGGELRVAPYMPVALGSAVLSRNYMDSIVETKRLEKGGEKLDIDVRGKCLILKKKEERE